MAVIELLRITCVPGRRDEFLARDAEVWTPALARHDGYIDKEVWVSLDDPDLVTIMVRWASLAQWKTFPDELNAELDAKMQGVRLELAGEAYEIYDE